MSEEEDLKYLQTEYEENIITELIKEVESLQNQLQQKENIIKEAKEYVYKMFNTEPANSREYDYHCGKLAEILDKENK